MQRIYFAMQRREMTSGQTTEMRIFKVKQATVLIYQRGEGAKGSRRNGPITDIGKTCSQ
jgi:hypothetical protein